MRTLSAALCALAVGGALVCGCSVSAGNDGKPTVSKRALQTDIAHQLTEAGQEPESVKCKEDLVGEVGNTVRCEVVVGPSNSFEPVVTVTRVDGTSVDYEVTPALSKEQLEKAVSRLVTAASGAQVDSVSCQSGLQGNIGAVAACDVDAGGVKLRRTVEVSNVDGLMMNFGVVPLLTKADVERSLLAELESQQGRRPQDVECSGDLEGKPGNTVDCTVVSGADRAVFTLTVTTVVDGTINYRYEPKA